MVQAVLSRRRKAAPALSSPPKPRRLPVARAQHFALGTASISILGYKSDRPDLAIIVLWNEVVPAATASTVQEK